MAGWLSLSKHKRVPLSRKHYNQNMKKIEFFLLILILIGAFYGRLRYVDRPVADWHSWRQADTSSVSRQFVQNGFDILHPKFDDLSKGVSLIDNPKGHRFVEFPIYNIAQAGLYKIFNHFSLEVWGRLVTNVSQVISTLFIFLLLSKYTSKKAGFIGASFYAFIPYNLFYGSVILPDSTMVMAMLGSVYFFSQWMDTFSSSRYFIVSIIFTAAALLLKPYMLFFMLPHLYLAISKFGIRMFIKPRLIIFALLSVGPLVFWRLWMTQFPEGIPQSSWLFNGDGIRFKGAFFNWLFAERISKMILGYFGVAFVVFGILLKTKKEGLLYISFLLSSLAYLFVMAKGNVQHDYYQILIIPTLALFFGKGAGFILDNTSTVFSKLTSYVVIAVVCLFMFAFSWFLVRDFYTMQHGEIYTAGMKIDKVLPKNVKVVAPFGGNTTFLYYINRQGWPVFDRDLSEFIKQGAQYMAFASPTPQELEFIKYFEVTDKGEQYIVFDLTKPTPEGKELLAKQEKKK